MSALKYAGLISSDNHGPEQDSERNAYAKTDINTALVGRFGNNFLQ